MAASESGRDLAYFTFGDEKLREDLRKLHQMALERNASVATLFHSILSY